MLDQYFFDEVLPKHLREMQTGVKVEVSLYSGESHVIKRVAETTAGYVVLVVYPREGEGMATRERPLPHREHALELLEDVYVFDRIVLPYGSITSVRLAASSPDVERKPSTKQVGFQFDAGLK
jgi:hypothetical protein